MNNAESCQCALDPSEMVERVAAWREVMSRASARKIEAGRITSVYPSEPALLGRLRELIAAEGECCAFLEFTVTEREADTVVELAFPPDASDLVEGMLSRA